MAVGAAYLVILQFDGGDNVFLADILFLLEFRIEPCVPLLGIFVGFSLDCFHSVVEIAIAIDHLFRLMLHVLEVQVLHGLILLLHLRIVVDRVAVEHLQIGFMHLVESLHRRADELQFILHVKEVLLLTLNLTHVDVDEVDVCLNLIYSLAELLVLMVLKESPCCIEIVIFRDCCRILTQHLLCRKGTTEDTFQFRIVANPVVDLMDLCNSMRLDGCHQFKVIHVVTEVIARQLLVAAVFQCIDNIPSLIVGQALGDSLETRPLEIAGIGEGLLGTLLLPGMVFLVVELDDDLAGTEQRRQGGEDGTETIASRSPREVTLQVGTILVRGSLSHDLGNDRQLVADELSAGVEEQEVGQLSDGILKLVGSRFQELECHAVFQ